MLALTLVPLVGVVSVLGLCIATCMVASAKGYSGFLTFIAFVLCAPAALFFALAMPARPARVIAQPSASATDVEPALFA